MKKAHLDRLNNADQSFYQLVLPQIETLFALLKYNIK